MRKVQDFTDLSLSRGESPLSGALAGTGPSSPRFQLSLVFQNSEKKWIVKIIFKNILKMFTYIEDWTALLTFLFVILDVI